MYRWARTVSFLLACSLPTATLASEDCRVPATADLAVNFHRVDSDLYRGGRPEYREDVYRKLADLGIRTIINLEGGGQARRERAVIERVNEGLRAEQKPELEFVSFPIDSFRETMVAAPSNKSMAALFARIQAAPKPIYLHCKRGKDRTGMVVLLYRLWRGQETFEEAYREARYYHFSRWNLGLKRTLQRYREADAVKSLGKPPATASAGVCRPVQAAANSAAGPGAQPQR